MKQRGFTLLEMLVATLIMSVAVVGLMSDMTASMRNATRATARDRAAQLGRLKMDELLLDKHFPLETQVEGPFDPSLTGGVEGGWRARMRHFELPPSPQPGDKALNRMELEVWWQAGGKRQSFELYGYRTDVLHPEEFAQ